MPEGSVAVTVTVDSPTGNVDPEAGLYVTVAEQLSVTVAANVAVPAVPPGSKVPYTNEGQLIKGA